MNKISPPQWIKSHRFRLVFHIEDQEESWLTIKSIKLDPYNFLKVNYYLCTESLTFLSHIKRKHIDRIAIQLDADGKGFFGNFCTIFLNSAKLYDDGLGKLSLDCSDTSVPILTAEFSFVDTSTMLCTAETIKEDEE